MSRDSFRPERQVREIDRCGRLWMVGVAGASVSAKHALAHVLAEGSLISGGPIRSVSRLVANVVGRQAIEEGLADVAESRFKAEFNCPYQLGDE